MTDPEDSSVSPASSGGDQLKAREELRQAIAALQHSCQADGVVERQTAMWACEAAEQVLNASPPAGEVGELVRRLRRLADWDDDLPALAATILVRQAEEIERLRKVGKLMANQAWNLSHTDPRDECALCIGVKEAHAALPSRPATADKPEEKHVGE